MQLIGPSFCSYCEFEAPDQEVVMAHFNKEHAEDVLAKRVKPLPFRHSRYHKTPDPHCPDCRIASLEFALKERDEELHWLRLYRQDTSEGFEHIETCDSYGCDCDGGCPVSDIPSAFRILRERLKERDAKIAELTSQLNDWKLASVLAGASGKSKQVEALNAKIAELTRKGEGLCTAYGNALFEMNDLKRAFNARIAELEAALVAEREK